MSALELSGVSVRFGAVLALDGLSLQVSAGEIVALVGGNASGKSTALRAVAGLAPLAAGTVRLCGRDVTRRGCADRARAGLALAAGTATTAGELTVGESLLLASGHRSYTELMGGAACGELAGLGEILSRRELPVRSLSTGERQLLAFAQALLRRPRVVLVDELSRGLAASALDRCIGLLRRAAESGAAVLVVEHRLDVVLRIARRAYGLDAGRLVLAGAASELEGHPELMRPRFAREAS